MHYFCIFKGAHLENGRHREFVSGWLVFTKEQSLRSMLTNFGACFRKWKIVTVICFAEVEISLSNIPLPFTPTWASSISPSISVSPLPPPLLPVVVLSSLPLILPPLPRHTSYPSPTRVIWCLGKPLSILSSNYLECYVPPPNFCIYLRMQLTLSTSIAVRKEWFYCSSRDRAWELQARTWRSQSRHYV